MFRRVHAPKKSSNVRVDTILRLQSRERASWTRSVFALSLILSFVVVKVNLYLLRQVERRGERRASGPVGRLFHLGIDQVRIGILMRVAG